MYNIMRENMKKGWTQNINFTLKICIRIILMDVITLYHQLNSLDWIFAFFLLFLQESICTMVFLIPSFTEQQNSIPCPF